MATEEILRTVTREAGEDLSAAQYTFVKLNASGQVIQCDTQGEQAYGILQNDPDEAGKAAIVAIGGISKCEAGEAVTAGNFVGTAADGQALDASLTTGDVQLGLAVSSAGAAGEIFSLDFRSYLGTHA